VIDIASDHETGNNYDRDQGENGDKDESLCHTRTLDPNYCHAVTAGGLY
jgi:hypothetical protein